MSSEKKIIKVNVRERRPDEPTIEVYHHSEKPCALNSWRDKDGAIIIESENGKRTRMKLP